VSTADHQRFRCRGHPIAGNLRGEGTGYPPCDKQTGRNCQEDPKPGQVEQFGRVGREEEAHQMAHSFQGEDQPGGTEADADTDQRGEGEKAPHLALCKGTHRWNAPKIREGVSHLVRLEGTI
jgi:hypothetical protein